MIRFPPALAHRHSELLVTIGAALEELETVPGAQPIPELEEAIVAFLDDVLNFVADHEDSIVPSEWQSFLVDFVHACVLTSEGTMRSLIPDALEDVILDACALDDDLVPAEQLSTLRGELATWRSQGFGLA